MAPVMPLFSYYFANVSVCLWLSEAIDKGVLFFRIVHVKLHSVNKLN